MKRIYLLAIIGLCTQTMSANSLQNCRNHTLLSNDTLQRDSIRYMRLPDSFAGIIESNLETEDDSFFLDSLHNTISTYEIIILNEQLDSFIRRCAVDAPYINLFVFMCNDSNLCVHLSPSLNFSILFAPHWKRYRRNFYGCVKLSRSVHIFIDPNIKESPLIDTMFYKTDNIIFIKNFQPKNIRYHPIEHTYLYLNGQFVEAVKYSE